MQDLPSATTPPPPAAASPVRLGGLVACGRASLERRELAEAEGAFSRAVLQDAHDPQAWLGLGITFCRLGRMEAALEAIRRAVALAPSLAAAHYNLGVALALARRRVEAEKAYRCAVLIQPGHAAAHYNRGLVLLKLGRYEDGWAEHEWRFRLGMRTPDCGLPIWDGGPLRGRRLLLHMEAGFGDGIQMIRFAPLLALLGAEVGVECKAPLVRLFRLVRGVRAVHAMGTADPTGYDLLCPSFSIPQRLGTKLETLPNECPYIDVPGNHAQARAGNVLNVGLVWAGDPNPSGGTMSSMDQRRSMPFATMARLLGRRGVTFHSLQMGEAATAEAAAAVRAGALCNALTDARDFADTAAVVRGLDLVISVDTAVAHLAGALGKPVWLLSRFDGCWRWIGECERSPWYPTMRLFHQPAPGEWGAVLDMVAHRLDRVLDRGDLCGAMGQSDE